MNNYSSPGGWRDRVKKSNEKRQARDDLADVRAERARLMMANAEKDAAQAAEAAAAVAVTRCNCPVCDTGIVTVELAERVYRALRLLPSDSKPDAEIMATLARIAQGQVAHGHAPRIVEGVKHPRAVRKKHSSNNGLTDDGALIDLDD